MEITGLTSVKAKTLRVKFGPNILSGEHPGALRLFLHQFNNSIVYLLLVAGIVSFFIRDFNDGFIITAVLILNTCMGFFQEFRTEKTLEKLMHLLKKHTIVIRNGRHVVLDVTELVPGDVVLLKNGDIVPADCILLSADGLEVGESQLTGESEPVAKVAGGHLYAGSVIESGEARAKVQAIGNLTRLGKIAFLTSHTVKVTRFGQSLSDFSSLLMKIALVCISLIFITKIVFLHGSESFAGNLIFMFAFAIAVIPEVLPVIVSVALAAGAAELAKIHVLVKKLSALEDLGNVTLLCTDKTGTLTENKITVNGLISADPDLLQMLVYASIDDPDHRRHKYTDPYDLALEKYISPELKKKAASFARIRELPYDSSARRKWVILENKNSRKHFLVEIGSAEAILTDIGTLEVKALLKKIADESGNGFRHQAVAYREIKYSPEADLNSYRTRLVLAGILRLSDPLRPGLKNTIKSAGVLGVAIKILTGDTKETAEYIAREIGLIGPAEKSLTGDEMNFMSEDNLRRIIPGVHVFAKLTPDQKFTLIRLFKENNVVAYQGDGINDAPSLKSADVAIAVDTATDIAKENADIVLMRRDLEVIISGIKTGRAVFSNINKYLRFTMIGNFSLFFTVAWLYLKGAGLPLTPPQLLLLSTFSQIPLITVSGDNVDPRELHRPGIYDIPGLMKFTLILGLVTAVYQLLYFRFNPDQSGFFLLLMGIQLIVIFYVRNRSFLWQAVGSSFSLTSATWFTYLVTIGLLYAGLTQKIFSLSPLPFITVVIVSCSVVIYMFLADLLKVCYYRILK